jgi:hypothetical protein
MKKKQTNGSFLSSQQAIPFKASNQQKQDGACCPCLFPMLKVLNPVFLPSCAFPFSLELKTPK